jgi:amidase
VAFALWVAASSERTDDEQLERLRAVAARGGGSLEVQRARAETLAHRDWLRTDTHRRRLQTGWLDLLDEHDVLLLPVSPFAALPHDPEPEQVASVDHRLARTVELTDGRVRPYLDQLVWPTVTGMAGLPCTVVPVGLTGDGLPVGVQVVGRPGDDLTTLRVGRLLGEVTGAPRRPPGWD